jgi:protein phosphatase
VGDSRLYLYRDGALERMTRDHSLVEEFVRQGRLTPEQAEKHPQRSVITRALGPESDVEVDTFTIQARDGDIFLLCSDGLSGMVSDANMAEIVGAGGKLEGAAKALIGAANENGGRDNITAVLFRVEDDGTGDARRSDTEGYDTIAGDQPAPSTEQIDDERRRISELDTQAHAGSVATAVRAPQRASPPPREPSPGLPPSRPRPAPSRRGRWLLRSILAGVVILAIAGGVLYAVTRSVWFVGTNDQGFVTLYRGLPYDLPLGTELYQQRYVSGVPALSLTPKRRKRVLDHQLRSHGDAQDLMRSLDTAGSP